MVLLYLSLAFSFGVLWGLKFTSSNNSNLEISIKSVLEEPVISRLTYIDHQRNPNTISAESALAKSKCGACEMVGTEYYECHIKAFPYNLSSFLFRPLAILDSGSLKPKIARLENVFWIFLVLNIIYSLRSLFNSRTFTQTSIPFVLFTLMFSVASATYEGNMGTAFRHKSSILWVMLLLICSLRVGSA